MALSSESGLSQAGNAPLLTGSEMQSPDEREIPDVDTLVPNDNDLSVSPLAQSSIGPSSTDASSVNASPEASRSFVRGGIRLSQGEASNPAEYAGGSSQLASVTNVLGNLTLQKVQRRTATAIEYAGGGTFYGGYGNVPSYSAPIEQLNADERVQWKRGQLTFNDSLQRLSASDFVAPSLGASGSYNFRSAAVGTRIDSNSAPSSFFGGNQLIDIGQQSYLTNVSVVDISEALTRRSSVSMGGAYALTDYLGNKNSFIDSRQISMQAGWGYQLNRRDEINLVYSYQAFSFLRSGSSDVATNSAQLVYRRRLSDRTSLTLGAGPQIANVSGGSNGITRQINAAMQAALNYRLEKSSLAFSYNHLVTAGSGLLEGGNSDIVEFSAERNILRNWQTTWSAGYARVSSISPHPTATFANSYQNFFAGTAVQRRLGPQFEVFGSYQFSTETYNNSFCGGSTVCDASMARRHVALVGFAWRIRPIRLD